jgi:hypothetical protein
LFTFLRDNARWLGGGFLLTMFSSFGQAFFIDLSGNGIRETFHLSGGGFGGIYMLATLASAAPWHSSHPASRPVRRSSRLSLSLSKALAAIGGLAGMPRQLHLS